MALPFIEVIESIAVRVLAEHVGIGDRQAVGFQPLVRHGGMHLRGFESHGQTFRPDEMFVWHKQTGAFAKGPLRRLLQFLLRASEVDRFARRRGLLRRDRDLTRGQILRVFHRVPRNRNGVIKQQQRRNREHDAFIMCAKPLHFQNLKRNISTLIPVWMCSVPTMNLSAPPVLGGALEPGAGVEPTPAVPAFASPPWRAGPLSFSFFTYSVRMM